MAPVLLPADAGRSKRLNAARRSTRFISEKTPEWAKEHAGEFVIVHDGALVAIGPDVEKTKQKAIEAGVDLRQCIMTFIPTPGATYYF